MSSAQHALQERCTAEAWQGTARISLSLKTRMDTSKHQLWVSTNLVNSSLCLPQILTFLIFVVPVAFLLPPIEESLESGANVFHTSAKGAQGRLAAISTRTFQTTSIPRPLFQISENRQGVGWRPTDCNHAATEAGNHATRTQLTTACDQWPHAML